MTAGTVEWRGRFEDRALNISRNKDPSRLQGLDAIAHDAFRSWSEKLKSAAAPIGLDEPITVVPADPQWPQRFREEAARLRSALVRDLAPDIQHIGSTAVPGMDAKPIVDLMIGLADPERIGEIVRILERFDYESLGEVGVPGRWALRKRVGPQPYNVSIIAFDGERWRLNLAIRDVLRTDADAARAYALAKWEAVRSGADMLLAYSDAKQGAIEAVAAKALQF